MSILERHIFVCINRRESGAVRGCCASKQGELVRAEFKKRLAALGLLDRVRSNKAGCLDRCEDGVVVVVYPEQVWYRGVKVEDVAELVERHIVGGEVVQRLLLPEQVVPGDLVTLRPTRPKPS